MGSLAAGLFGYRLLEALRSEVRAGLFAVADKSHAVANAYKNLFTRVGLAHSQGKGQEEPPAR